MNSLIKQPPDYLLDGKAALLPGVSSGNGFPLEIIHLLEVLTRIEMRRQDRLRQLRQKEVC